MRVLILLVSVAAALTACSRSVHQKDFASPEDAAQALIAAAKAEDTRALIEVLGADAEPVVNSGDPVRDRHVRERFVQAYDAAHAFDRTTEGTTTLYVGADEWPFPFPLLKHGERWSFDSSAGADEIVNRRVGENELDAIQACLAFVDAEREYYWRNPEKQTLLQYAQKLASSPGHKDGLYWQTTADELPSPLGEQFARARSEGYFEQGVAANGKGYRGYIYRLLTAQGPNAAGGAYDYLVGGKMIGGFALLAFPVEYGTSGVMTFIVNHDGVVYSKDLGPTTTQAAGEIAAFDPDSGWKQEAAIEPARQAAAR